MAAHKLIDSNGVAPASCLQVRSDRSRRTRRMRRRPSCLLHRRGGRARSARHWPPAEREQGGDRFLKASRRASASRRTRSRRAAPRAIASVVRATFERAIGSATSGWAGGAGAGRPLRHPAIPRSSRPPLMFGRTWPHAGRWFPFARKARIRRRSFFVSSTMLRRAIASATMSNCPARAAFAFPDSCGRAACE